MSVAFGVLGVAVGNEIAKIGFHLPTVDAAERTTLITLEEGMTTVRGGIACAAIR